MERPVEVTFRDTVAVPAIEALVRREAVKLERYYRPILSCRVAIERPQRFQRQGSVYRVRLVITAGTRRPIVVTRDPRDSDMHDDLRTILLGAFKAARHQLQSMGERQRGDAKTSAGPRALVVRLFPKAQYGFLKTLDGREIYFHRNSVLHDDFERLAAGTEVRFEEVEGDKGPQASSVQIVHCGDASSPSRRIPHCAPRGDRRPLG